MNSICLILLRLYTAIKGWFSPPHNQCSHCTVPELPNAPTRWQDNTGLKVPIKFKGAIIGNAYTPHTQNDDKSFTTPTLIFKYDALSDVFLNGVPVGEGQKLAFDLCLDNKEHSVYLVSSNAPFYTKRDNEEIVILDNVLLESDWP